MARGNTNTNNKHGNRARIPTKIKLPFNYIITVRQFTEGQFNNLDKNSDGLWNVDNRTIYIRKSLPLVRRRYILTHELGHAFLDWQHLHLDEGHAATG